MIRALALASTPNGMRGNGRGTGGTAPPSRFNPNRPDSATNDVPPASGSPEEAFEKQCKANPQACG